MSASRDRIIHLGETDSTNKDAMRLALAGEALPLWVHADRQTGGRGRSGRSWVSKPGNLYASLALSTGAPLKSAPELSLVAGIAVYEAVCQTTALAREAGLRLKWPNDILIGAAKAGGILVETTTARGQPGFVAVIGIGVNIANSPDDLGRAATAIAAHGAVCTPHALLSALADQADLWLARWDDSRGFPAIREAWMARAGAPGEAITVNTARGPVSGSYHGLSATGALSVLIGGSLVDITYGDVALAAAAGTGGTA